jgi:uncharacterized membrane protein
LAPHTFIKGGEFMKKLVAIVYEDKDTAQQVYETLHDLQTKQLIDIYDVATATKDQKGKLKLHQNTNLTGEGALAGSFWGLLIGALFFAPVFGLLLGAGTGALAGGMSDYGIDDKFMKNLGREMKTGNSAVFVLADNVVVDKVIPKISTYGGKIVESSLSKEAETKLQQLLDEQEQAQQNGHPVAYA